mgnify:CR=1 FL=1
MCFHLLAIHFWGVGLQSSSSFSSFSFDCHFCSFVLLWKCGDTFARTLRLIVGLHLLVNVAADAVRLKLGLILFCWWPSIVVISLKCSLQWQFCMLCRGCCSVNVGIFLAIGHAFCTAWKCCGQILSGGRFLFVSVIVVSLDSLLWTPEGMAFKQALVWILSAFGHFSCWFGLRCRHSELHVSVGCPNKFSVQTSVMEKISLFQLMSWGYSASLTFLYLTCLVTCCNWIACSFLLLVFLMNCGIWFCTLMCHHDKVCCWTLLFHHLCTLAGRDIGSSWNVIWCCSQEDAGFCRICQPRWFTSTNCESFLFWVSFAITLMTFKASTKASSVDCIPTLILQS